MPGPARPEIVGVLRHFHSHKQIEYRILLPICSSEIVTMCVCLHSKGKKLELH